MKDEPIRSLDSRYLVDKDNKIHLRKIPHDDMKSIIGLTEKEQHIVMELYKKGCVEGLTIEEFNKLKSLCKNIEFFNFVENKLNLFQIFKKWFIERVFYTKYEEDS